MYLSSVHRLGAGPDPHQPYPVPLLGMSRLMLLRGSIMWLAGLLINRPFPGECCTGGGEWRGETAQPLQQLAGGAGEWRCCRCEPGSDRRYRWTPCLFFSLSWRKKEALDLALSKTVSFCFRRWKPVSSKGGGERMKEKWGGGIRRPNVAWGWSLAVCHNLWPWVCMIKEGSPMRLPALNTTGAHHFYTWEYKSHVCTLTAGLEIETDLNLTSQTPSGVSHLRRWPDFCVNTWISWSYNSWEIMMQVFDNDAQYRNWFILKQKE